MLTIIRAIIDSSTIILPLPVGAKILSVHGDNFGQVKMELLGDREAETENRKFLIGGHGDTVSEELTYIGAFTLNHGQTVGHIFEGKP